MHIEGVKGIASLKGGFQKVRELSPIMASIISGTATLVHHSSHADILTFY